MVSTAQSSSCGQEHFVIYINSIFFIELYDIEDGERLACGIREALRCNR